MRVRDCMIVGLLLTASCGAAPHPAADLQAPDWYEVRFQRAVIEAHRPDGSPWRVTAADDTATFVGGLVGLAIGAPALGVQLGSALSDPGGDALAPSPYIVLKVGAQQHRILPAETTYTPSWTQPIMIDARGFTGEEVAIIQFMDAGDDSLMQQHEMPFSELVSAPSATFTGIGSIASLDLQTRALPRRTSQAFDLVIPANLAVKDLVAGRSQRWQPIPVMNGDTVTIEAQGSVCATASADDCFGAAGAAPGRWQSYSYEGFKDFPHLGLVGITPGMKAFVGPQRTLKMPQSGKLLLFINDEDVGNNRGELTVHVRVDP